MPRQLSCLLPPAAYADSYDLSLGSISIDSTASGQTVVQKGKTAVDQAPVITQKSAEATQNTISVHASSGSKAVLTLDGVNIDTSRASDNGSPVSVSGSGSVKLCFRSENTLMAGRVPGIEKSAGGWLEIAGEGDAVLNTTGVPGIGSGAASDADGKEIPPDYSALRKGGLVEFFDSDGKLLRSYSLDTPSGVLK